MAVTDKTEAAELAARAARVIPGGVNSGQRRVPGLEELVIAATSGSTFTDGDGNTYTDYHAAFGPPLLGHSDPDVDGAVAAAAREVGLMGIGVTRDRGRARRADLRARAVGRARAADRDRQRGDLPRAARRARRDRPPARRQVPGLLPRLARLGRDERDLAARERRQEGPALEGDPPRGRSTRRSSAASTTPTRSSARSTDHDVAAIILEPIPHNIGARAAAAGLPRAAARARDRARDGADLRRGDHRLPPRARRLPVDRRRHARPDDDGQGDGQRLARVGARRQGRADGALLARRPGGPRSSPARSTATRRRRPRRSRRSTSSQREPVHEHVFALGERARQGLRELYARLGVPVVVSGFGSVFVTYFLDGAGHELRRPARERRRAVHRLPPRADASTAIFELPLNLKRSHFSYAHTDADVDRLLEATEAAVTTVLEPRR